MKATDVSNQEQALQEMQKKVEDGEKSIKELKEEVEREKEVIILLKAFQLFII